MFFSFAYPNTASPTPSNSWIANRWIVCKDIIRWDLWETRFPQVVRHWKTLTRTIFLLEYANETVIPSRTQRAFLDNVSIFRHHVHDSTYPKKAPPFFFLIEDWFAVATVSLLCRLVLIPSGGNRKSLWKACAKISDSPRSLWSDSCSHESLPFLPWSPKGFEINNQTTGCSGNKI